MQFGITLTRCISNLGHGIIEVSVMTLEVTTTLLTRVKSLVDTRIVKLKNWRCEKQTDLSTELLKNIHLGN